MAQSARALGWPTHDQAELDATRSRFAKLRARLGEAHLSDTAPGFGEVIVDIASPLEFHPGIERERVRRLVGQMGEQNCMSPATINGVAIAWARS